jgi:hypothetical protein
LLWPSESFAQRTSVARDFPIYDNGGKPDLVMDPQRFVAQMEIVDRVFAPDDCAIAEGVIGGAGVRRLLRFDTVLMNRGDGDLVVGDRSDPYNPYAAYFVFHECHGHYHIRNFSIYELLTLDGQVVMAGTLHRAGHHVWVGRLVLQAARGPVDRHHRRAGGRLPGTGVTQHRAILANLRRRPEPVSERDLRACDDPASAKQSRRLGLTNRDSRLVGDSR